MENTPLVQLTETLVASLNVGIYLLPVVTQDCLRSLDQLKLSSLNNSELGGHLVLDLGKVFPFTSSVNN